MNILVCISQVPDTTTKVQVASDGISIDRTGVKFILNPYDEFALEEGLQLREKFGGTVTALTVGGETSKEILRTALAMGADKAILIKDEHKNDSYSVAFQISEIAKTMNPDVLMLGRQSIDYDSFAMAPMLGELLGLPSISMVSSLTIDGNLIKAERDIEGGKEVLESSLPCVISAQKGLNNPRYPKLPDIMKAKSKPIEEIPSLSTDARISTMAMQLPISKRIGKVSGDSESEISDIVLALHEEAKVI